MSELAFNKHGERFEPPAAAAYWRVRRLQPGGRGLPEVVFGSDGAPLVVAVDTELSEFRTLVNDVPGRYRLDAIDDDQKPCDGACPSYLHISNSPPAAGEVSPRNGAGPVDSGQLTVVELLIQANTEMVKSITDKFATVMDSAATLIRAADGAGLPARDPMALPPELAAALRNAEAPQELEEEEDEDGHPHLATVIQMAVDRAMPLVNHTINTKVLGMSVDQSIALMGGGAVPINSDPKSKPTPTSTAPAAEKPKEEPKEAATPPSPPDFMSHVMAVEALLTPEEVQIARQAIGDMAPAAIVAWREQLLSLSPEKAAEMIGSEITKNAAAGEKEAA